MSRYITHWAVRCEHRNQCPYLNGMSTKWILDEYFKNYKRESEHWRVRDLFQEEQWELYERIKRLEKENEELKTRIKAMHQKQFKKNNRANIANSTEDTSNTQQGPLPPNKKRGAPKGHPGWFRKKPDKIDKHINVEAPQNCPHCQSKDLSITSQMQSHIQEDIVITPQTVVTEFLHQVAHCNKCNKGVIKLAEDEMSNAHIGPVTKAAVVYLRYDLNIPYRKIKKLFEIFFGMCFVPASAMAFDRRASKNGEGLYEDIRDKIRQASIIHADETHWRENGQNKYLWYKIAKWFKKP